MKYKYLLFIPLIFLIVSLLASCGKETVIREVLVTTPTPATEAPVETLPVYKENKYDKFVAFVNNNSGQARSWNESDLIELASLTCEAFDNGASLSQVIDVFSSSSSGKYDDELYAAIIGGAVTYICPEWAGYVDSQLS